MVYEDVIELLFEFKDLLSSIVSDKNYWNCLFFFNNSNYKRCIKNTDL